MSTSEVPMGDESGRWIGVLACRTRKGNKFPRRSPDKWTEYRAGLASCRAVFRVLGKISLKISWLSARAGRVGCRLGESAFGYGGMHGPRNSARHPIGAKVTAFFRAGRFRFHCNDPKSAPLRGIAGACRESREAATLAFPMVHRTTTRATVQGVRDAQSDSGGSWR